MSIKNSFIRDIQELIANVQPKPDASGYYKYLGTVESDLIANYSSCFEELATYEGLAVPKVEDNNVLEAMKERLKNSNDLTSITGLCKDVDCPEYLDCGDCLFASCNLSSLMRYLGMEHTEPQVEELPKLTVEVFDRPDCPEWANYAVVNCDGRLTFFADKPKFEGEDYGCWSCSYSKYKHINNTVFDASDWENSLIERPKKQEQLPDWVCEGALAWDKQAEEYVHVVSVTDHEVQFDGGTYCTVAPEHVAESYDQAFERPFNEQEMRALVGKVLLHKASRNASLVTGFTPATEINGLSDCTVYVFGRDYTDGDLMRDCLIDGNPCKVYEHLNEKGEKVK